MSTSPDHFQYLDTGGHTFPDHVQNEKVPEGETNRGREERILDREGLGRAGDLELEVSGNFQRVIDAVNKDLDVALAPRDGNFHITIIGPKEKKAFEHAVALRPEIFQSVLEELQAGLDWTVTGIGYIDGASRSDIRRADSEKKVLFAALEIPRLQKLRQDLGLPHKDFHITLGFVKGDIHLKIAGKGENSKDVLTRIDKRPDPAFDHYLLLAGEIVPATAFSGASLQKKP